MKVFLTNPPLNMAETPLQYHRPLIPLGLAYLGAMLEDKFSEGAWSRHFARQASGETSRPYVPSAAVAAQDNMLLSFYRRYSYDSLRLAIEAHAADADALFIGLSVLSDGMVGARTILTNLRRDFPFAQILVGGPHATSFPDDFYVDVAGRRGPLADYVVQNEGELAIIGIIDGLLENAELAKQHGPTLGINPDLCRFYPDYRIINGGQFGATESRQRKHVLDTLPAPAYFLFEDENGELPYEPDVRYGLEAPAANINSSRGCPHKCTFCTIPLLVPGYRSHSPERMAETVRFLVNRYGVKSIFFREDNFMFEGAHSGDDRWDDVERFCDLVHDVAPGLRWAIEARADNLLKPAGGNKARLDVLAAAGLSGIYIGVESGSDAMLKLYVKGSTIQQMSDAIRACSSRGIAVVTTACYGDPDIFLRRSYPLIDLEDDGYQLSILKQREQILECTRAFMDLHEIPPDRREEYALVGIPISAAYRLLDRERVTFPDLVEHFDPVTRYIYPKGFRWWSATVYDLKRLVRPYVSFSFQSVDS